MESFLYYFFIGFGIIVIYRIGKFVGKVETVMNLQQVTKEFKRLSLKDLDEDQLDTIAEELKIERLDPETYLAYSNGDFVAQGRSFKELIRNTKDRYPQRVFKVVSMDSELTEDEAQRLVDALKSQHDQ